LVSYRVASTFARGVLAFFHNEISSLYKKGYGYRGIQAFLADIGVAVTPIGVKKYLKKWSNPSRPHELADRPELRKPRALLIKVCLYGKENDKASMIYDKDYSALSEIARARIAAVVTPAIVNFKSDGRRHRKRTAKDLVSNEALLSDLISEIAFWQNTTWVEGWIHPGRD